MNKTIEYYALLRNKHEFSLAYIEKDVESKIYISNMYFGNIDMNIDNDLEIIDNLNKHDIYDSFSDDILNAINAILKFWSLRAIKEIPTILKFDNIKESICYTENIKAKYIIFKKKI